MSTTIDRRDDTPLVSAVTASTTAATAKHMLDRAADAKLVAETIVHTHAKQVGRALDATEGVATAVVATAASGAATVGVTMVVGASTTLATVAAGTGAAATAVAAAPAVAAFAVATGPAGPSARASVTSGRSCTADRSSDVTTGPPHKRR